MKRALPIAAALDAVIAALGALVLLIWASGGTVLDVRGAKVELSALDPWALALALLAAARIALSRRAGESPVLAWAGHRAGRAFDRNLGPRIAAILLGACFSALFAAHWLRHLSLHDYAWDATAVLQPVFRILEPLSGAGPPLRCDICLGGSYLGEHLAFTLALLAPVTAWLHSPAAVFAIEAAAVGVPLWLALRHGPLRRRPEAWAFAAMIALSQRALRDGVVWDFREDHLAFAFLLGAGIALQRGRAGLYALLAAGAMLSKENVALVTAFLAGPILLDRSLPLRPRARWALAGATALASFAWAALAFKVVQPAFLPGGAETLGHPVVARLREYGSTPAEILSNVLLSPAAWWALARGELFRPETLKYVVLLVGPFALFLRRAPSWVIPAVPGILMNVLPHYWPQTSFLFHYELVILPFLILGAWSGMERALAGAPPRRALRILLVGAAVALCLSGRWPGRRITENWPDARSLASARALSSYDPGDEAVAAHPRALAQLPHVRRLRILEVPEGAPPEDAKAAWAGVLGATVRAQGRSGPAHGGLAEATRLIVDLDEPWQKRAVPALGGDGWREMRVLPGGRFVEYRRGLVPPPEIR